MLMTLIVATAMAVYTSSAFAQTASGAPTPPVPAAAAAGLWVGLALVYLTRRTKIGGWLLYFYLQLYVAVLITAALLPSVIGNFSPREWDTRAHYVGYLIPAALSDIVLLVETVLATLLLWRRNEAMVRRLTVTLLVGVAVAAAAVCIDMAQDGVPKEDLALDCYSLVVQGIWCTYFYRSKRVRCVFVSHDWVYAETARTTSGAEGRGALTDGSAQNASGPSAPAKVN